MSTEPRDAAKQQPSADLVRSTVITKLERLGSGLPQPRVYIEPHEARIILRYIEDLEGAIRRRV